MTREKRVVVTGGAGFIGANVSRLLSSHGYQVVILDDLSTGSLANLTDLDAEFVQGSILDAGLLDKVFAGAMAVIHLAARPSVARSLQDPMATHVANATGTLSVLEAARGIAAYVVVASSSSVYGTSPALPKSETVTPSPISPYAASKLAAEAYSLSFLRCFRVPTLVFRFFNVYGPLQSAGHPYAAVIPQFLSAALARQPVSVHGDGHQTRDFTYVDTVARVIEEAVRRRVTYDGAVNLAFGTRTSILDLLARIERILGADVSRQHLEPRAGDVRDSQADNRLLLSLFPEATSSDLGEGLTATIEWFRSAPVQWSHNQGPVQ